MKKNALWVLVVIAAALIQTTWLTAISVQGVAPNLTLLLVVFFAIVDGEERAMFTGILGGMYQDVASNAVLGHHILVNVVAGYVVGRIATRLVTEHPAVKVALVLCASLLHGVLFSLIQYVQNPDVAAIRDIATTVIPGAFYTALVTPVIFFILARFFHADRPLPGEAI